jgi:hypothetical protein
MAKYIPYYVLNNPDWAQPPEGAHPCWYFSEISLPRGGAMPVLSVETSEYFRLVKFDELAFHGHLGRLREGETYFTKTRRGLSYFDDFQSGKKGYFAFDQAAIWRLESILPGSPLVFILKKFNLMTMEDYKQGNSVSITGDGNVVAAGTGNTVHVGLINVKGNLGHLREQLAKARVPSEDISEIVQIVQQEKPGADGQLPPKTQSWLNKMVGKAASGTWEIIAHTAGHLLAGFIKSYYGLPG